LIVVRLLLTRSARQKLPFCSPQKQFTPEKIENHQEKNARLFLRMASGKNIKLF